MHVFAKIIFVAVGYSIHMYLGKTLAPIVYGQIGVIMSIININYNFLSNGARQAASHLIAIHKFNEKDLIIKSYKYQILIAFGLSTINYSGAGLISQILNHPELKLHIQITSIIIPFTALYFISIGILNGYKILVIEALSAIFYAIARLSLIPFVKMLPDSAMGAILGFFVAAVAGCIVGHFGILKNVKLSYDITTKIDNRDYFRQIIDFLSFFFCIPILLNMDMLFENAMVHDGNQIGYYTGASNFSKVSYYLLSAIYLVALPIVTTQYSEKNVDGCKKTINNLFVIITGFILPIVTIAGPICENLMEVFYTTEYRAAGLATEMLMISQFFLGLFVIINILICSTKEKKFSILLGSGCVIIDAILCYILIPMYAIQGAALASLLTNILGVIVSIRKLIQVYGKIWSQKLFKIIGMNIIIFIIMTCFNAFWRSDNFIHVLMVCGVSYCSFVILMGVLRLIKPNEIIRLFALKSKWNS